MGAGPGPARGPAPAYRLWLTAALALGICLRLAGVASNPSLSIDEARLALNIAGRGYGELLGPLAYDQSAPPFFLWLEKAASQWIAVTDRALRILPVSASLAALLGFTAVARRILAPRAGVLAVAMMATSAPLIAYTDRVKQYGFESFVTVVLLLLALRASSGGRSRYGCALLFVAAVLAPWFSAPSIFVLVAIAGSLIVPGTEPPTSRVAGLGMMAAWVISWGTVYLLAYGPAAGNPYLVAFWQGSMLEPWAPGLAGRVAFISQDAVIGNFLGITLPTPGTPAALAAVVCVSLVLVGLLLAGAKSLLDACGARTLIQVAGPVAAAVLASVVGLYPLSLRTLLFASPLLLILGASGAAAMLDALPRGFRAIASAVIVVGLVMLPLVGSLGVVAARADTEPVRMAIGEFMRNAQPGEPIYVSSGSVPAWAFYTTDWASPDSSRLRLFAAAGTSGGPAFENAPAPGSTYADDSGCTCYRFGGRTELLGWATGMQLDASGTVPRAPSPLWAEQEAARIQTLNTSTIWLLFSRYRDAEMELLTRLRDSGGRVDFELLSPDVVLTRFRLQPTEHTAR